MASCRVTATSAFAGRQAGFRGETVPMQFEIFWQGLYNASVLATPGALMAVNGDQSLSLLELAALALWAGAWSLEALADRQKRRYVTSGQRKGTCQEGLWTWSRHPNYFFQWLQWAALALAAAPSLVALRPDVGPVLWLLAALALLSVPAAMYWVLVYFTGARPAEHYSVQKRPSYVDYQQTTNMFFPGPRRPQRTGSA